MAAKIFALLALLALSVSATTAVFIPQWSSPLSVVATIPQYFPSVTGVGSSHLFMQFHRQHQAFVAGISPFSVTIPQLPYLYSQGAISQFPYLYNQFAIPQLPYLHSQLALSQPSYLYNQLAIPQLPYLYNQLAIPQLSNLFSQLATTSPATFLPFNQLAVRNPAAFWQQPIVGGAFF